jgi:putative serine/threonine protein kinase
MYINLAEYNQRRIKMMNLKILDVLAKGKHGIVYNAIYNKKKCVVKKAIKNGPSMHCILKEGEFLRILNKKSIGPKLFYKDDEKIVMEKVKGKTIEEIDIKKNKTIALSVLNQCYEMDKMGISKFEMTNPHKHIFIYGKKVKMIDFERCSYTKKPKNVTQFCEYLRRRGCVISREALIDYKKNPDEENFEKIKKRIIQNLSCGQIKSVN